MFPSLSSTKEDIKYGIKIPACAVKYIIFTTTLIKAPAEMGTSYSVERSGLDNVCKFIHQHDGSGRLNTYVSFLSNN